MYKEGRGRVCGSWSLGWEWGFLFLRVINYIGELISSVHEVLSFLHSISYLSQGGEELSQNVNGALVALRDLSVLVRQ